MNMRADIPVKGLELVSGLPADVMEYCHIREEDYKNFCFRSTTELARLWRERKPKTVEEIEAYYRENWEWYIGDLAWWHVMVEGRVEWFTRHVQVLSYCKAKTVLDWGGGIGTDSLILAANGFDVTLYEMDNPAMAFAEWRAKKYDLPVRFVRAPGPLDAKYDCTLAIDVLEHLPDYLSAVKEMAARSWLLCISCPFKDPHQPDEMHPQHFYEDSENTVSKTMTDLQYHPFEGLYWIKNSRWRRYIDREIRREERARYKKAAEG